MVNRIKIANRWIGDGHPPMIVAEIGINHNGEFSKARALIDTATEAGADAVKFQTHFTEHEMIHTSITPGNISSESLFSIIKRCELTAEEQRRLKEHAESRGIIFFSTPFSIQAAQFLDAIGVPAFKIGSGEVTNHPLIEYVSRRGKPVILSTGMSTLEEIRQAVELIRDGQAPLALLACTSTYPAEHRHVKLGQIARLRDEFGTPVGLSDHSIGIYTALGAVALGACIVEKHFTINKNWPGPDQKFSLEPNELRELVKGAKAVFEASGSDKQILEEEKPIMAFARASVVALRDIEEGEILTEANIWVKRPGTGEIPARDLRKVLGKRARRYIKYDQQLKWTDMQS